MPPFAIGALSPVPFLLHCFMREIDHGKSCDMISRRHFLRLVANKTSAFAVSGARVGTDEKYGHAALEYLHEKVHANDPKKTKADIRADENLSQAFDRICSVAERTFEVRLGKLIARMNEAMEELPEHLKPEALLLDSSQPPLTFRRPSLTPPVPEYTPGYGFDVAPLRAAQYDTEDVHHVTDSLEVVDSWPFVEPEELLAHTMEAQSAMESAHGELREAYPITGIEGEGWEACVALNKVALARQKLILDLCSDPVLKADYDSSEEFRAAELERRGIIPLEEEESCDAQRGTLPPLPAPCHYAQLPKYTRYTP